jgi:hypothetical protein
VTSSASGDTMRDEDAALMKAAREFLAKQLAERSI